MRQKEKEFVEKFGKLPAQLQDKMLDQIKGAALALEVMDKKQHHDTKECES